MATHQVGTIGWVDLTVAQADKLREFYAQVVGWRAEPVDMGGYSDFNMLPPGSEAPAAGLCHARGVNAGLPPQWLIYVTVADLARSRRACLDGGGEVLQERLQEDGSGLCVIRDPAGAVLALFQPAPA